MKVWGFEDMKVRSTKVSRSKSANEVWNQYISMEVNNSQGIKVQKCESIKIWT